MTNRILTFVSAASFFISAASFFISTTGFADLKTSIHQISSLYGSIDDFYFKDTSNDRARRSYADALWKCTSYVGQLPEDSSFAGVTIRGPACPIEFVRAYNQNKAIGFTKFDTHNSPLLEIFAIPQFRSQFTFKSTSDAEKDVVDYAFHANYIFMNHDVVALRGTHHLDVAKKVGPAHRLTQYDFILNEEKIHLEYRVDDVGSNVKKTCVENDQVISCSDFAKNYGPIELIPSW